MASVLTSPFDSPSASGRKLLLAASTGGHLSQLLRLAPGLGASDDSLWVTFRTPQSESLLKGRRVMFVPYVKPRDVSGIVNAYRSVRRRLRTEKFDGAVSTGAGLALAALPAAAQAKIPTLYVESVSRVTGPSVSGRILAAAGISEMRTQHPSLAGGRWSVHPSVLETYCSVPREPAVASPRRIFVTLGTIEGYRFDSVVDRVLDLGIANEDTVWQLGCTTRTDRLPGTVHSMLPAEQFERALTEADVVITHSGVGTIMGLLERGIYPVAIIRRRARKEHVDDHQAQIADLLTRLDIGAGLDVGDLDEAAILRAAQRRVRSAAVTDDVSVSRT